MSQIMFAYETNQIIDITDLLSNYIKPHMAKNWKILEKRSLNYPRYFGEKICK